jgi:cell division protein FtsQ
MTTKTKRKAPSKKRKTAKKTPSPKQRLRILGIVFAVFAVLSAGGFAALFVDFAALPQQMADAGRASVRAIGFRVDEVDVRGARRFTYDQIKDIAKVDHEASVFGQDIAAMQQRLEKQTWIESARIMRKLPNVLSIDVTEHEPFARWQLNGQMQLVDLNGKPFMLIQRTAWRQLPLIVGPGAPDAVGPLADALDQHPALARRLASATRIGNRRWDLAFRSGAIVKLPEEGVMEKMTQLSRMQVQNQLLDGGALRIDMRMDQMLAISTAPAQKPKGKTPPTMQTAG